MKQVKKDVNRIAKVNSLIQHGLGPVLLEFQQGQGSLITITKVETTKDMKYVKVWISVFGADQDKILKSLNSNIYEIQGELNKHFSTKIIPRLSFRLDTSAAYVQRIDEAIRKIHEEDK
jgi:ribosome-binding factor A